MSIIVNPIRATKASITRDFSQRLIARLVMKLDDPEEDYLSSYDQSAIQLLRECHSQDTSDVDLSDIAVAEFVSLNPKYKIEEIH